VRSARLWAGLLGLVRVVAEGVEFDEAEQGHDAWVVGGDDVVLVDWYGATDYAQSKPPPPDRSFKARAPAAFRLFARSCGSRRVTELGACQQ